MIVSPSIGGIARRLTELLPTIDLPDSFQRKAQLPPNYIGHVFVPSGVEASTRTSWQAVLESSLAQLSMQGEIAELRSQNEFLKSKQQRLESENKEAGARIREPERQSSTPSSSKASTPTLNPFISNLNPFTSTLNPFTSTLNPFTSTRNPFTSTLNPFGPDSRSAGSSSSRALGHLDNPPTSVTPPSNRYHSILEALRLQNEFDKEDRALSAQRAELAKSAQRLFECGICMEEMPHDSIARPDPCGHAFCRECLRGHVAARLNERRFPILCPTCTASNGRGNKATGGTRCERTVILIIIS
jgi:Ring finger domain